MLELSQDEQRSLLALARRAIEAQLAGAAFDPVEGARQPLSENLRQRAGAFVTLRILGQLRGCIGYLAAYKPLFQTVAECAVSAASSDPRFPPLSQDELDGLAVDISVLSELQPITPEDVQVGVHGLVVSQGYQRGVLLPHVAVEQGWTAGQFLEETCAKAGLPRDAWRQDAALQGFTAATFSEQDVSLQ